MTLHRACTLCVLTDHRKEQDIAFALMISLVMIMGAIGCREPFVQNFRQDAYPSRAVSAGENRSSSTIGWGT
jgi:hypothetical protein